MAMPPVETNRDLVAALCRNSQEAVAPRLGHLEANISTLADIGTCDLGKIVPLWKPLHQASVQGTRKTIEERFFNHV
jgi:hypothetical protein